MTGIQSSVTDRRFWRSGHTFELTMQASVDRSFGAVLGIIGPIGVLSAQRLFPALFKQVNLQGS